MTRWDEYFLKLAELSAEMSKDSTKIGAVIVGEDRIVRSSGFNGIPRGVQDLPERMIRPVKYFWTEHAERNAIFHASRQGANLLGTSLYLWGAPGPCSDCARAIIQVGIKRVLVPQSTADWSHWGDSLLIAREMFLEAGVEFIELLSD